MGEPEDEKPWYIHIPEYERNRLLEGPGISSNKFVNPLNIKKVNIGSLKIPKFAYIGDYWDDDMVGKIIVLLH